MPTSDPHVKLLRKAFGDLDTRPFAWCFDEDIPSIDKPAAAPQEPRAGETYISSWSELLHTMTDGALGTPPQPLRRYEPQQK